MWHPNNQKNWLIGDTWAPHSSWWYQSNLVDYKYLHINNGFLFNDNTVSNLHNLPSLSLDNGKFSLSYLMTTLPYLEVASQFSIHAQLVHINNLWVTQDTQKTQSFTPSGYWLPHTRWKPSKIENCLLWLGYAKKLTYRWTHACIGVMLTRVC